MTKVHNESENQNIETPVSSDLNALKESIIKDTIDEISNSGSGLFSNIKKKLLTRYLTDDGKRYERMENYLLESIGGKLITKEIKEFKENLNNAQNEAELNNLKASILENIKTTTAVTATGAAVASASRRRNSRSSNTSVENSADTKHYEIDQFNINVSQEHKNMYDRLTGKEKPDLEPFACAMKGYEELKGSLKNTKYLTVVDFTKPNDKNRFYVINMTTKSVEYATTVGHGQGSGTGQFATSFSDISGSNQSSLGFFRTPNSLFKPTNRKRSGLLMNGIEDSNDSAKSRGIYMHPGGKISQGCFTLPKDTSSEIMDKVKGDSLLFAYAKSKDYFSQSQYFDTSSNGDVLAA